MMKLLSTLLIAFLVTASSSFGDIYEKYHHRSNQRSCKTCPENQTHGVDGKNYTQAQKKSFGSVFRFGIRNKNVKHDGYAMHHTTEDVKSARRTADASTEGQAARKVRRDRMHNSLEG